MIRVKVCAPPMCDQSALDERGWLYLPDGAVLKDALKAIRLPRAAAKLLLVSVNGIRAPMDAALSDGDVVGFIWLATGG